MTCEVNFQVLCSGMQPLGNDFQPWAMISESGSGVLKQLNVIMDFFYFLGGWGNDLFGLVWFDHLKGSREISNC